MEQGLVSIEGVSLLHSLVSTKTADQKALKIVLGSLNIITLYYTSCSVVHKSSSYFLLKFYSFDIDLLYKSKIKIIWGFSINDIKSVLLTFLFFLFT